MKPWVRNAIACIVGIEALGLASAWLSGSGDAWFDALAKPAFMPPDWAFPVAWTILYALLGVSVGRILALPSSGRRDVSLILFGVQLALNLIWSPVFFGLHLIVAGFAVILAMLPIAAAAAWRFWRMDRTAGLLLVPYLVWLMLALALNIEIHRLNS